MSTIRGSNDRLIKSTDGGLVTISLVEYKINKGIFYNYSDTLLNRSTAITYLIHTNGSTSSFWFYLTSDQYTTISIVEEPTVTEEGTQQTLVNYNRLFDDNSEMEIFKGATISSGVVLRNSAVGVGEKANQAGFSFFNNELKFVFKPETYYAITLTPSVAADIAVSIDLCECLFSK